MGSDLPFESYFCGSNKRKAIEISWKIVWILLQLRGWKSLSLQDSFWTSLLVTHVPKYSVEPGPQSKQKHPHTSTDYPGTQTLSTLPPEKLALSLLCWEAQPQQQRQLCPDHPALLVEQIPLHLSESIGGAGFSSGCRIVSWCNWRISGFLFY